MLKSQIAVYLSLAQRSELHPNRRHQQARKTAGAVHHGHRRVKNRLLALQGLQLRHGGIPVPGFAQDAALQVHRLVRSDDHRMGVSAGDFLGLLKRQAGSQIGRLLAGPGLLIHLGRAHRERHTQPLKQFAAVNRGRTQHKRGRKQVVRGSHAADCPIRAHYTDRMKSRQHDPLRLDVAALATEGQTLEGAWPGATLDRLAPMQTPPQDDNLQPVAWSVQGERRAVTGGEAELWLHLRASTRAWLTCQRCLQPFQVPVEVDRSLRFVRGESQAEALDAESEDDVLALPRALDVRELVEDELLLEMPIVPRHDGACPQPLPMAAEPDAALLEEVPERPNPFAALAALKKSGKPD